MTSITWNGDFLRVVLFAEGVGSDPSLYRPASDETQWWNRRDALVRCVAAFLFGPSGNDVGERSAKNKAKELVIVYDQDLTMVRMKFIHNRASWDTFVPSESAIINLWKRAAKHPGQQVEDQHISCCLERVQLDGLSGSSAPSSISATSSKREILSFLQSVCSVNFLRKHRLNSPIEVVARKANKKVLLDVWEKWKNEELADSARCRTSAEYSTVLEGLLQNLLLNGKMQVTAATLHESSENELPCWDGNLDNNLLERSSSSVAATAPASQLLVLFLGAVRDMTTVENQVLRRVCSKCSRAHGESIPLLQIRLGPVAEFTSKILSVIGFHHHHGRLIPSVLQLLCKEQTSVSKLPPVYAEAAISSISPLLHFACLVPITCREISPNICDRSSILWSMVRCTVTCLWRSRLAGEGRCAAGISALQNRLTFLFADGVTLTLNQEEFVASMAEKHLAAPSEFQILSALHQKAAHSLSRSDGVVHRNSSASSDLDWRTASKAIVKLLLQDNSKFYPTKGPTGNGSMVALDFVDSTTSAHDRQIFYSRYDHGGNGIASVSSPTLILLAIASTQNEQDELSRRRTLLVLALQKKRVLVLHGRSLLNVGFRCIDQLASIITMLQHLCYQRRLIGLLQKQCAAQQLPKKRKSDDVTS